MGEKAHLKVSHDTWRQLNAQKEPGDTFEDVIQRLIEETDDLEEVSVDK